MRTLKSTRICLLAVGMLAIVTQARAAGPLGTAITYQGRLQQNGAPVNGTVDLAFGLWDGAGVGNPPFGGNQIGVTQVLPNVPVADGLFAVELDFGANAFNGEARWLQLSVNNVPLAPRQELPAGPYALYALKSSWSGLTGVPGSFPPGAHVHNASDVTSGTLADVRLSSNVDLLDKAQTFTGAKTFSLAPSFTAAGAPFTVSSGTKVANLNADLLDGLNSTAFLQSVPNPLALSGSEPVGPIIKGTNTSTSAFSSGVFGESTAATGGTMGVRGQANSTTGFGVFGYAGAAAGTTYGGYFWSESTSGRGVYGLADAASGTTYGVFGQSDSTSGRGVFGLADAASGTAFGLFGQSESTGGRGVFGFTPAATGETYGVFGQANSTSGVGVAGLANSTTGTSFGVWGESNSSSGRGVYGLASATSGTTDGVRGTTESDGGRGVVGWATSPSGTTRGVYGRSDSSSGKGVYGWASSSVGLDADGVYGRSDSRNGTGVHGYAGSTSPASAGISYGVYGECEGDGSRGVGGYAAHSGDWGGIGVEGITNSPQGYGVKGSNQGGSGSAVGVFGQTDSSSNGIGVYGLADDLSGVCYGVYGIASQSSSGYGVYSYGRFAATGTKASQIDHPLDPRNKYLNHYCPEGPEPQNFYNGVAVLGEDGAAWVELPSYFEHVNKDFRYQLTCIGAFAPVYVADEIAGNRFRIAGGKAGLKVSWEVKAVRNDLWMRAHGAPVEQLKTEGQEGKYLHPELYGEARELGLNVIPRTSRTRSQRPAPEPHVDAESAPTTLPSLD